MRWFEKAGLAALLALVGCSASSSDDKPVESSALGACRTTGVMLLRFHQACPNVVLPQGTWNGEKARAATYRGFLVSVCKYTFQPLGPGASATLPSVSDEAFRNDACFDDDAWLSQLPQHGVGHCDGFDCGEGVPVCDVCLPMEPTEPEIVPVSPSE